MERASLTWSQSHNTLRSQYVLEMENETSAKKKSPTPCSKDEFGYLCHPSELYLFHAPCISEDKIGFHMWWLSSQKSYDFSYLEK